MSGDSHVAPMRRHKRLFIVLLLGWIAWCGVMVALYYTTVRPHVQLDSPKPQATSPAPARAA